MKINESVLTESSNKNVKNYRLFFKTRMCYQIVKVFGFHEWFHMPRPWSSQTYISSPNYSLPHEEIKYTTLIKTPTTSSNDVVIMKQISCNNSTIASSNHWDYNKIYPKPKKFHWDCFCSPKKETNIKIHTSCDKLQFWCRCGSLAGAREQQVNRWCSWLILPSKTFGFLFEK